MTTAQRIPVNSGWLSAAAKTTKPGTAMLAFLAILAAIALLASAGESPAADIPLPPVNLGDTSFQDAIAFPGWLVEETFSYYHANQFNDYQGHDRPGSNRLTIMSAVTHVAWISNFRLLGGFYGAEVLVPVAQFSTSRPSSVPRTVTTAWGMCRSALFSSNGLNTRFSTCPSFSAWISS